jgi:hypothetical protein
MDDDFNWANVIYYAYYLLISIKLKLFIKISHVGVYFETLSKERFPWDNWLL